jgi:hypothetical protein
MPPELARPRRFPSTTPWLIITPAHCYSAGGGAAREWRLQ